MAGLEYRLPDESQDHPVLYFHENIDTGEIAARFACDKFIRGGHKLGDWRRQSVIDSIRNPLAGHNVDSQASRRHPKPASARGNYNKLQEAK